MPDKHIDKPQYEDPADLIWDTYLQASKDEDAARPKNWEGSTTGILTFTGLFAATVAAFIVESYYKLLSVDSGDQTVQLLSQLLVATANASSGLPIVITTPEPFSTPPSAIATNALWFTSLLISLICALLSTLVQEWSRAYVQDINRRKVLHETVRERAFNHIYIRMGVNRYGMDQFVSWIVALVHLAVFLFACGLLVFLFLINHVVAGIATMISGVFVIIYCVASLLPLLEKSCPYRTPVTYLMAFIYWFILHSRIGDVLMCWRQAAHGNDQGKTTFRVLITRQYVGGQIEINHRRAEEFLDDTRGSFLWKHMYVHISRDVDEQFFKLLPEFIDLHRGRDALLSTLCADNGLVNRFYRYLVRLYSIHRSNESSTPIPFEIFPLVSYLSERMFASEVEHYDDGHTGALTCTSPMLLKVVGMMPWIATLDGPARLQAQLCLARVRESLLRLCLRASTKMPTLQEEEVSAFINETSHRENFELMGRHPSAILLLLASGTYRGSSWESANESKLLPLHDGSCCRGWKSVFTPEGRAHVAACNVLTMIAYILNSDDDQRQYAGIPLYRIIRDVFSYFDEHAFMPQDDRMKIASPEFVNVLRLAGLDEWLEPGSTLDTAPNRDGPNYWLLTATFEGYDCTKILRDLARLVTFEAYFERVAAAQRLPMALLPTLGTVNSSDHPHLARPVAHVVNDPESTSPRNTRTSTIDGNIGGVSDHLPASSEHGASALAGAGKDAATDSQGDPHKESGSAGDPTELERDPATGTAAPLLGGRSEDKMNGAGVPELETVTIDRDRNSHTENRGTSDGAVFDTRARADADMSHTHGP
ncbi:unnamed protein product [Peniophora sp. CBMAI 1063]|nr:unnamed protein product [Peniophora sp. CBMAI 1063]